MTSIRTFAFAAALAAVAPFSARAMPVAIPTTEVSVIQVHGFHCEPEWTRREGWHRHWRACQREHPEYNRRHEYWRDRRFNHEKYGEPRWR